MKWVTRQKVHVDRVACPWLIKKFIDPEAEFVFVPRDTDPAAIKDGIPFDMKGVELGHHEDKCSFDAFMEKYDIQDPIAKKIQLIVREADTGSENPSPLAIALDVFGRGYSLICHDDHETLEKEFFLYDALYAYFKKQIDNER
ncbi:MAG: chromate resistance protein [Planctomycetes bacterium]|nr:chromate resistance protein [Planctomycetota bacterium]